MIENQPNEITLIFHSDKDKDKKMRAFVETISTYKVKTLDLKKESITELQLAEVAEKLTKGVKDLVDNLYLDRINIASPEVVIEMSDADILKLVSREPVLLTTPILIIGKIAYLYESAYQILKQTFNTTGVGSAFSANVEEKRDVESNASAKLGDLLQAETRRAVF